ncbi:hypothetical protein PIB30_053045 [Stylosanthes scabra]|uniref:Uncharacterized protein n=1 Tax=Stylosanthes scabra TaxID=79078 RepID=A0ABU6TJJ5_9FABA|nr:hypothetical protein [Stylosanthes scabra]
MTSTLHVQRVSTASNIFLDAYSSRTTWESPRITWALCPSCAIFVYCSLQKKDTDLEQNEAVPVAKVGGGVGLPKNDVYDALWAMLDAESDNEAEGMTEEWDLDSTLLNWGKNKPDVGPAGPNQGPPPTKI